MTYRGHTRHWVGSITLPLLTAILLAAMPGPAAAQDEGDIPAGRHLADTWCSSCHVVEPTVQHGSDNGAPAFTAVAGMSSTTPMALRAFLQTPHAQMPDLHLSRDEIDDLTAYILSLRRK
ncbi:MAG: c-type cytochrome [Acetobacteraceae bacterium]|jgi:mono/diheme cytochrome c family protein